MESNTIICKADVRKKILNRLLTFLKVMTSAQKSEVANGFKSTVYD